MSSARVACNRAQVVASAVGAVVVFVVWITVVVVLEGGMVVGALVKDGTALHAPP